MWNPYQDSFSHMAADSGHLTDLYETDVGLMQNYCTGCMGPDQQW